jgi:hypothetical protein
MDANDHHIAERTDALNASLATAGWLLSAAAILLCAIGLMVTAGASSEENMFVPAGFLWFVFGALILLAAISVWITLAGRLVLRRFQRR